VCRVFSYYSLSSSSKAAKNIINSSPLSLSPKHKMERIDSIHSSTSYSSADEKPPKPILINTPPNPSHHSRRSISGIDILNGLKIMTNSNSVHYNDNVPNSPVPSSAVSTHQNEHQFSQIDDFEIKEAIGKLHTLSRSSPLFLS
jgi:hypothetical protein